MEPIITLHIMDEQEIRQSSLREEYLRWLAIHEANNRDNKCSVLRPGPDKTNIDSCFL